MTILQSLTDFVSAFFNDTKEDFLTWTPGEKATRAAVLDFLKHEPEWIEKAIESDPALSSKPEEAAVKELLTYQGLQAIAWHQKAHALYEQGEFAEARKISQGVRRLTAGIEIHPGANIGKNFFIDHGSGVVIGETAEIGDNVMLYHRVTLGSDGKPVEDGTRRHPKIGSNTTIFTGAEILGASTIGENVTIGSGTKIIGSDVIVGDGASIGPNLTIRKSIKPKSKVIASTQFGEPIYDDVGLMKMASEDYRSKIRASRDTHMHP